MNEYMILLIYFQFKLGFNVAIMSNLAVMVTAMGNLQEGDSSVTRRNGDEWFSFLVIIFPKRAKSELSHCVITRKSFSDAFVT